MKVSILLITDLPVWSMGDGKGAPSFYNTLKLYASTYDDVVLLTTEKDLSLPELDNLKIAQLKKILGFEFLNKWNVTKLVQKHTLYFLNQILCLRWMLFNLSECRLFYAYEIGYIPAAILYSRIMSKPVVSRFQGTVLTPLLNSASFIFKMRFFDQILAVKLRPTLTIMTDDGTKGDLVINQLRGDTKDTFFWKNGVDAKAHTCVHGSEIASKIDGLKQNGTKIFCSASRLVKWKRLDRSINVFHGVKKRYSNAHYFICGNGPERENLEKLVAECNLVESVTFLGELNSTEIHSVMYKSDFFISLYELSNLGNPLFEAIVENCTILTLNNGSTGELIIDGINGVTVEEADWQQLPGKICNIIENVELQNILNINARKDLEEKFVSWDERMEKEIRVVNTYLGELGG